MTKPNRTYSERLHRRHIYFSRINLAIITLIFAVIGAIILINSLAAPNPNLPGDLNNDNTVNALDLSIMVTDFNTTNSAADINGDGHVNVLDLSILLAHYGQSLTPKPTVLLSANPTTINSGQSSTLSWSSTNATSCTASGAWSGAVATSGSKLVSPTSTSTYSLSCTGAGGSATASATVSVSNPPPPASVNWYPGYYVLAALGASQSNKQTILDDPIVAPFNGVQFRYAWVDSELAPHDYSVGFSVLDADLANVAAHGKKLLVMLQYKNHNDVPVVPADLRQPGGPWCSGNYCGELSYGGSRLAMVWNSAVSQRLAEWISAMAAHIAASQYSNTVAGIVFNETSLPGGVTDITILSNAGYDPYKYMTGLQNNLLAVTQATSKIPAFYYHEGGFVSMDGSSVNAGKVMGDWMLQHPHTGTGTPDATSLSPKNSAHPCANSTYQGKIPCNPDIQSGDYSTSANASLDGAWNYMTQLVPNGLDASFLSFSYAVGPGPNAFTLADVSAFIPNHTIPNRSLPPGW